MADRLLTTRELEELLQLDRVTIYRMVKDGDLPALRVGGQWRFSSDAISAWLQPSSPEPAARVIRGEAATDLDSLQLDDLIDIATLQGIQNQFAQLVGVAAFITDLEGQPFAPCSRCSRFCQTIHSQPEGMAACQASWRSIAGLEDEGRGDSRLPRRNRVCQRTGYGRRPAPGPGDGWPVPDRSARPRRLPPTRSGDRPAHRRLRRGIERGDGLHRYHLSRARGANHQPLANHCQCDLEYWLPKLIKRDETLAQNRGVNSTAPVSSDRLPVTNHRSSTGESNASKVCLG